MKKNILDYVSDYLKVRGENLSFSEFICKMKYDQTYWENHKNILVDYLLDASEEIRKDDNEIGQGIFIAIVNLITNPDSRLSDDLIIY